MTNKLPSVLRRKQRAARLAWLRAHPEVLADLPGEYDEVSTAALLRLDAAASAMIEAGLFRSPSRSTSAREARRASLLSMVTELRGDKT